MRCGRVWAVPVGVWLGVDDLGVVVDGVVVDGVVVDGVVVGVVLLFVAEAVVVGLAGVELELLVER